MADRPREDFDRLGDLLGDARPGAEDEDPRSGDRGGPGHGGRGDNRDRSAAPVGAAGEPTTDPARRLAAAWPDLVGDEIAANTRLAQLRSGRLVVTTSSSAWAQSLHLMSEAIVDRVNERLGAGTVERVVFRHAGWEEEPAPEAGGRGRAAEYSSRQGSPTGSDRPLSAAQTAALEEVRSLGLAPELEAKIVEAMERSFRRGAG